MSKAVSHQQGDNRLKIDNTGAKRTPVGCVLWSWKNTYNLGLGVEVRSQHGHPPVPTCTFLFVGAFDSLTDTTGVVALLASGTRAWWPPAGLHSQVLRTTFSLPPKTNLTQTRSEVREKPQMTPQPG